MQQWKSEWFLTALESNLSKLIFEDADPNNTSCIGNPIPIQLISDVRMEQYPIYGSIIRSKTTTQPPLPPNVQDDYMLFQLHPNKKATLAKQNIKPKFTTTVFLDKNFFTNTYQYAGSNDSYINVDVSSFNTSYNIYELGDNHWTWSYPVNNKIYDMGQDPLMKSEYLHGTLFFGVGKKTDKL